MTKTKTEEEYCNTDQVTLGEVNRKLEDHIKKQEAFEKALMSKIDDLNLILKVFKWIGWAITIIIGTGLAWFTTHFLNGK